MTDAGDGACAVCGREPAPSPERVDGRPVCSSGCAAIESALDPETGFDPETSSGGGAGAAADHRRPDAARSGRDGRDSDARNDRDGRDRERDPTGATGSVGTTTTFLRVAGMHSTTCEAFLERRAEATAGVTDARASYVTGTVRVEHEPATVRVPELCARLTTLGYDATERSIATADAGSGDDAASRGPGGRERTDDRPGPTGPDEGIEELLGFRYVAGVVFGTFLMVPYVVVFYPANAAALLGADLGALLPGPGGLGGVGLSVLPLFGAITGVVLFFTGAPLLRGAWVAARLRRPTVDLAVALTVLGGFGYSVVALALGRMDAFFDLTVAVAAGVVAATLFETRAKRRAAALLTDLTAVGVDTATRVRDREGDPGASPGDGADEGDAVDEERTETVDTAALAPGDRVLVSRGERIPVDGTLDDGGCTVDESVVTGESLPVAKAAGDALVGGSVVTEGAAVLRVGPDATSGIDRLTTAVWSLQSTARGGRRRVDRWAARAVPAVLGLAGLAAAAGLLLGWSAGQILLAVLAVPVAASPWALGLAGPLTVGSSVERAAERGVVVLEGAVFEQLDDVDTVVFDKTGTLTTGEMRVLDAAAPDVADPDGLFGAAAAIEGRVTHPVAEAIASAYGEPAERTAPDGGTDHDDDREPGPGHDGDRRRHDAPAPTVSDLTTHATGAEGRVDGTHVLVGNPELFEELDWTVPDAVIERARSARDAGQLAVLVGRGGGAEGVLVLGDEPRAGWADAVTGLAERDVEVVVLTGDGPAAAEPFGEHPGVTHVFADVRPPAKTVAVRRLGAGGRTVAMVGDGTNDAPALAAADLGIGVGSGTALALAAADLALVEDDPGTVLTAIDLAAGVRERMRRTAGLALGYNAVAVPALALGALNPLVAVGTAGLLGGALWWTCSRPLV